MATTARAALGMKHEASAGATSSKAVRIAELTSDREAIHNHMAEVAKAALGKNFDEQKTDNGTDEKQAIQNHMVRVAKAALGQAARKQPWPSATLQRRRR
jgi:hypothetical protein